MKLVGTYLETSCLVVSFIEPEGAMKAAKWEKSSMNLPVVDPTSCVTNLLSNMCLLV